MEFFDSHSHYNDEKFDQDREAIIEETYQAGMQQTILLFMLLQEYLPMILPKKKR